MPQYNFSEAFLQLIWQQKAFNSLNLCTTQGQALGVASPGLLNTAAGPDFELGQIQLDGLAWNGPIEIHLRSSDWYRHQHQKDRAYDQVILHVVYEHDQEIKLGEGRLLPTLELKGRIDPKLIAKSQKLLAKEVAIPCGTNAKILDELSLQNWLARLAAERLEQKNKAIEDHLKQSANNWASVFYQQLARSFGLLQNAEAMEQLARRLPLKLIAKLKLWQVEALAFGQAGMLENNFQEAYPQKLQKEYQFLQKQYQLEPIPTHAWKWSGMRPSSFPSLRIALLIRLLKQQADLFRKSMEMEHIDQLRPLFKIELEGYWLNHYRLDQLAKKSYKKRLTRAFFDKIAINTLLPMLFAYGKAWGQAKLCERAVDGLASLAAEQHRLLRDWSDLGLQAHNAMEAQGLLQLRRGYCDQKRCLECRIGQRLLFRR